MEIISSLQTIVKLRVEYDYQKELPKMDETNFVRYQGMLSGMRAESVVYYNNNKMDLTYLNKLLQGNSIDDGDKSQFYLLTQDYHGFVECTQHENTLEVTHLSISPNLIRLPIQRIVQLTKTHPELLCSFTKMK